MPDLPDLPDLPEPARQGPDYREIPCLLRFEDEDDAERAMDFLRRRFFTDRYPPDPELGRDDHVVAPRVPYRDELDWREWETAVGEEMERVAGQFGGKFEVVLWG